MPMQGVGKVGEMRAGRVALVIGAILVSAPALANDCREFTSEAVQLVPPDDHRSLARAWMPQLERYLGAVPALSPREEAWLMGELQSGNWNRISRAMATVEHHQMLVRRDAEYLVRFMRNVIAATDRTQQARWWLRIQSTLLFDVSEAVAALVAERRLDTDALPRPWVAPGGNEANARSWLRSSRIWFANDIAMCALPAVFGLPLPGTPGYER